MIGEITTLVHTLQQTLPPARLITDLDALRGYPIDGLLPGLVTIPNTVEEAAQIIAAAHEQHLTVMARGGGSQTNLGGLAERIDVLLQTTRLDSLLEHEGPDLTCQVEAGITLATLQEHLRTQGQRLSLDPPGASETTIGGILATNASGPKRLRYGTARDLVIGMRVVQADGEIARSGGRVVKNVAGYDLNKLYIGSLGTLGIIVEANFKLHPLPQSERTLLLSYARVEDAMQTVIKLMGSLLTPSALELIDTGAANDMADLFGVSLPTSGYTLAVNVEGSRATIARQIEETRSLARQEHALLGEEMEGPEQDHFWDTVREHTQGTLTCKTSVLLTQVVPYLTMLQEICNRYQLESASIAHAGNGVIYTELRPGDATSRLLAAITELRRYLDVLGGVLVIERCPVEMKRLLSIWGEPKGDFRMMQSLKQQFDPQGTFVRGRFLGGL
ncbi:MAG TPA: FAD-binding oxidoreductase [Ktedonobacteraceae bacterium]|jgi:glycolate oxidase FAD binding subunit|nr:FAD-binding oxidoreductase [Ktedonobacteraceae bacterium]